MAAALMLAFEEEIAKSTRPRIFRDRSNNLDNLDDLDFLARYRLPRTVVLELIDTLTPQLSRDTLRCNALPVYSMVLATLRYYSKGGFLSEIGDLHGLSKSSVSRVFTSTTAAILDHVRLIGFPSRAQAPGVMAAFHEIGGLPRVLGAIDGTHIAIQRPHTDEAAFVCRKGFHSINVQAVCDAQLRFTNIVTKWPGSTHDAHMFNTSSLKTVLEDGAYDGWLLGDSGYACRPYLLTPLMHPSTDAEMKYNRAHIKTRNTIERAFGLCKSRFRCLHKSTGCILFSPEKSLHIIRACMQLHNLAINLRLPVPDDIDDFVQEEGADHVAQIANQQRPTTSKDGQDARHRLIQSKFTF